MNLKAEIVESIIKIARECGVKKVILFGSRARGNNRERSDIDLAFEGGNSARFALDVDDFTPTLLKFDFVNLSTANEAILKEIEKDGVILYEQT